jgi:cell division septation protein DedD
MQQPVATVNGTVITTGDFQKRVKLANMQILFQINQLQNQRAQFANDPQLSFITQQIDQQLSSLEQQVANPISLGSQVLNSMVEDELIREEAAKRNITVASEEVQTSIEHDFNFYRIPPTATPTSTASPTPASSPTPEPTATTSITPTATPAPTSTPEPTATPVTEQSFTTQFNNYLAQLAQIGMTRDDAYALEQVRLLRQKLEESFSKDVPTSADQVQFRYILFETEEGAQTAEAQIKAGLSYDDLYKRVESGQVVSATTDLQTWTPTEDLTQTFGAPIAEAALSLTISQTSQIITGTPGIGGVILQQEGREVRPLTSSQIQSKQQAAFQAWLTSQRSGPGVNLFNNRYADRVPAVPTPTQ